MDVRFTWPLPDKSVSSKLGSARSIVNYTIQASPGGPGVLRTKRLSILPGHSRISQFPPNRALLDLLLITQYRPLPEEFKSTNPGSARCHCYITQCGPLPEESNHTIWAPPGGVKFTEPGSARNYRQITKNTGFSSGEVKSHHTGSSRRNLVHRTGLCPKLSLDNTQYGPFSRRS